MSGSKPDPNSARARARAVFQYLNKLRKEARVSVPELCRRIGKKPNYFERLEDKPESLNFTDFVAIVQALGFDPSDALDEVIHRIRP